MYRRLARFNTSPTLDPRTAVDVIYSQDHSKRNYLQNDVYKAILVDVMKWSYNECGSCIFTDYFVRPCVIHCEQNGVHFR